MTRKPLDLALIREGDVLMGEARRLNPDVRMPSLSDLERIMYVPNSKEKTTGRPRGAEPTVTIALRIPESMCAELDGHVERLEAQTGLKASRTAICRRALRLYLDQLSAAEKPVVPEKTTKPTASKRPRKSAKAAKG